MMSWWSDRKLTSAVRKNNAAEVEKLILEGADPNKIDNGKTIFMWSVEKGHTDLARCLLGKGANVDDEDRAGRTVLITAAEKGHTEIAQSLLERAADMNVKDGDGWTALRWATSKDHTEIAQSLRESGAEE
ncbi:MAG TPA: hypothetical protein DIT99_00095 [Candidatus Latescibacteria bacterium]|nr:hypothetical protein [Candidatus Latescibacterota bacterium]